MTTDELVKWIDSQEYILPKAILDKISKKQLVIEVEEIYKNYPAKLDDQSFRNKYTDLVSYLYQLSFSSKGKHNQIFIDPNVVTFLLSSPETK